MNTRSLYKQVWDELSADKSLIMLVGPRQAGKTTFAKAIVAKDYVDTVYFNWDVSKDKKKLIEHPDFFVHESRTKVSSKPLVIFDEIHKYRDWKNYLKGVYDQYAKEYQFLITGSGRLDFSRKAGDSLAGRFLKFHIFPLTLAELSGRQRPLSEFVRNPLDGFDTTPYAQTAATLQGLWEFSGFPEPFFKGRKAFWSIWSEGYGNQIVRDDLRTVADIRNLDTVELLFSLLPSRIASPMSINNIAGDLQVSFDTVKNWLMLFDSFYLTFRLSPWTGKITRSILKEKKAYLFNFPVIEDEAARFENLVAVELLRAVEMWNDRGFGPFGLHYLRNKDKQEVDFLIVRNNHPFLLLEAKLSDESPATQLLAFQRHLNIPAIQLVKKENVKKFYKNDKKDVLVVTAHHWLSSLP